MRKSKQENPINNYSPQELKKGWMEKLEKENKEISLLYNALNEKTLETFGEKEGKKRWKEIVKDYDKIQQMEPDKEKKDGLLKSFLRKKIQESEGQQEEGPEAK